MGTPFKTIGILGKSHDEDFGAVLVALLALLRQRGHQVVVEARLQKGLPEDLDYVFAERSAIGEMADLAIVIGGDGSLLSAARTLARHEVPVLGVNRGRLGFLTDINPDQILHAIPLILDGHYESEQRFLLDSCVVRNSEVIAKADALNDVVVNSGASAQMIEYELYINDLFVYRQRADGLIVSTPTGSTAYSLSGGGPIMHPSLDAVVLVPMFPHALSSRPIVVDGNSTIRIDILPRNRIHPPVTCDGQMNMTARPGDSVVIQKKPHRLTLLHPVGHSFYASCRDKLHWSAALVD
jgi:NAD+ kinase